MPRPLRDLLLVLAAFALCPLAALVIGQDPAGPIDRAQWLIEAERALGLHVEPAVHAWGHESPGLMRAAGAFYVFAHVPVIAWALVWTWCLRRDAFAVVRDLMLWIQVLTVSVSVLVPTAPPRLTPGAGFQDTLSGLWGRELADSAHLVQSPFAAMPSGHVAFALAAGGTFAVLGDRRWLRAFGWLYPPLVVLVTVLTGNHLWLDAAGGAVVAATAFALSSRTTARTRRPPPATTPARRRPAPRPAGAAPAPAAARAGRP